MADALIVSILGLVITIIGMLGGALYWLGGKFREMDTKFEQVNERFIRLSNIINAQNEFLIEFLGYKGVLDAADVVFLKNTLRSMMNLAVNPFTEEEKRRLHELIDNEESEELLRLARKFVDEYGDRGPDVWKMLFYAAAMHGITLRKYAQRKEQK